MRRLDMMLQMGVAKEGFDARRVGADKRTCICVRENVLLQSGGSIECLVAIRISAVNSLRPRGISRSRGCGDRC